MRASSELAGVRGASGGIGGVAEERVHLVLLRHPVDDAALDVGHAPLRDRQAARDGLLAHRDVVGLRAGEVLQQVPVRRRRHDTEVDRDTVVRDDRGLRIAARRHLRDGRQAGERLEQHRRVVAGGDQVDVADRLAPAPQRSRLARRHAVGQRAQTGQQLLGARQRPVEQDRALARAAAGRDRGEDLLLRLAPRPAMSRTRSVSARDAQLVDGRDAERVEQLPRRLRADPRKPHDVDQARRILRLSLTSAFSVPVSRSSVTFAAIVSPTSGSSVSRPSSDRRMADSPVWRIRAAALR